MTSASRSHRARVGSRIGFAIMALLIGVVAPSRASGQALATVIPSTRIRVELRTTERSRFIRRTAQSIVGDFVGIRSDTVLLLSNDGSDPIRVPLNATRQVFVSGGTPSWWRSALRGAVLPALTGAALKAVSSRINPQAGDRSTMQQAAASAAWGAAYGAVLGGLAPKERWREVAMPATGTP